MDSLDELFGKAKDLAEATQLKQSLAEKHLVPLQKALIAASGEEKKRIGREFNQLKNQLEEAFSRAKDRFLGTSKSKEMETLDLSVSNGDLLNCSFNPLSEIRSLLIGLFHSLDFSIESGSEIVTTKENFENLKVPADHPSRSTNETFYLDESTILRPHCTVHSINRLYQNSKEIDCLRIATIGSVYRRDDETARHVHQFSQLDFLWLQKGLNVANLKYLLGMIIEFIFGKSMEYRLRNSYFPFTQPSVEADIRCHCNGKGECAICGGSGWIEILGAGLFRREILDEAGYSQEFECLAGGMGLERLAMLKYRIGDIRLLYSGNLDFLNYSYGDQ